MFHHYNNKAIEFGIAKKLYSLWSFCKNDNFYHITSTKRPRSNFVFVWLDRKLYYIDSNLQWCLFHSKSISKKWVPEKKCIILWRWRMLTSIFEVLNELYIIIIHWLFVCIYLTEKSSWLVATVYKILKIYIRLFISYFIYFLLTLVILVI